MRLACLAVLIAPLSSGCFGFTSPKGKPGSSTGGTSGSTVGGTGATGGTATPFTDVATLDGADKSSFDAASVEVAGGATQLKAKRFLLSASTLDAATAAGATLSGVAIEGGAFVQAPLSAEQRRTNAFAAPTKYAAWSLEGASPFADLVAQAEAQTASCSGAGCPTSVAGTLGSGLRFTSSTSQAVAFAKPANLPTGRADRAICVWARPDQAAMGSALHYLVSWGRPSTNQVMSVGMQVVDSIPRLILSTYGPSQLSVSSSVPVPQIASQQWVHVCGSYLDSDGIGPALGVFTLWLNGGDVGQVSEDCATGLCGDMDWGGNVVDVEGWIGAQVGGGELWRGDLDEPVIFTPSGLERGDLAQDIGMIYRFTGPASVRGNVFGSITTPVFDAGQSWPWSGLAVQMDAPYHRTPSSSETGFGGATLTNADAIALIDFRALGNPVDDHSGNGHTLSCTAGSCPNIEVGDGVALFDPPNPDSHFYYMNDASTALGSVRTVCFSAGAKANGFDGSQFEQIVSIGDPANSSQFFDIGRKDGFLVVQQPGTGIQTASIPVFDVLSDFQGMHAICVVRDGTRMRAYVDGSEVLNEAQAGSIASAGASLFLGKRLNYAEQWHGVIGMLMLFSRPLTVGEVQGYTARALGRLQAQVGTANAGTPALVGPSGGASFISGSAAQAIESGSLFSTQGLAGASAANRFVGKVDFAAQQGVTTPRITSLEALPAQLPQEAVVTAVAASNYVTLTAFSAQVKDGSAGQALFRLQKGNETFFWNGTTWALASATDGSPAADINAHLSEFVAQKGTGSVKWQALLRSIDRTKQVGLVSVSLSGTR